MKLKKCIEKTYCMYASEWHLAVMLLPFISKNLKEQNKVYMEFEESIEDKINILLDKLEIQNKNEVKGIKWNNAVSDEEYCDNDRIYIISGNKEYIDKMNEKIEKYYADKDDKIRLINCYELSGNINQAGFIDESKYDKKLNTKGEISL